MQNMKLKNPILNELDEDALDHVTGGTEDDGWYWGFGFPPDYLYACPKCRGGVYSIPATPEQGGNFYQCGPCGWIGRTTDEFDSGYLYNF